jgi:hypothetical protein
MVFSDWNLLGIERLLAHNGAGDEPWLNPRALRIGRVVL